MQKTKKQEQQKIIADRLKKAGLKIKKDRRQYIGGTTYEMTFITRDGREFTFYNDEGILGCNGCINDWERQLFIKPDDADELINLFKLFDPDEVKEKLPTASNFTSRDTMGDDLRADLANGYHPDFGDEDAIDHLIANGI